MYRIKLTSGDEANYGSMDELAQAVKAGTVTDTAAIYHARAEKWLPIASHPHYKMAKDRIASRPAGAPTGERPATPAARPSTGSQSAQRPGLTASGQRPAIGASGQRPVMSTAPRPTATGSRPTAQATNGNGHAPTARTATAERTVRLPVERRSVPQAPAPAPRPALRVEPPAAPVTNGLDLLRADAAIDQDQVTPPRPAGVEIEQTPTIEAPEVIAQAPRAVPIEQVPEPVELESVDVAPAGGIELIHPDRSMNAPVQDSPIVVIEAPKAAPEPASLDIPAPVRDFAPIEPVEAGTDATERPSRAPLYIGLGLAAAAVLGAVVFLRRPAAPAPSVVDTRTAAPVAAPVPPPPTVVGAADGTVVQQSTITDSRSQSAGSKRRRDTEPDPSGADGLEPPPAVVIPAAPSVKAITDAASLPTVEAGSLDLVNKQQALEKTVREIDSSMRRETGKSGGSTR